MPYLYMAVTTLLWASAGVAGKYLSASLGPLEIALLRNGFALLFFVPLALYYARRAKRRNPHPGLEPGRGTMRAYAISATAGLFGFGLMQGLFFLATSHTLASHVVLIMSCAPLVIHLADSALQRRRLALWQLGGHALALSGLCIAIGWQPWNGQSLQAGDGYALLAMLAFSAYTLLLRKVPAAPVISPAAANVAALAAGSFLLLACAWLMRLPLAPAEPTAVQWSVAAYLGLLCTGVANLLYQLSLQQNTTMKHVAIIYFQPLAGIALSAALLGEPLAPALLAGTALCTAGVMLNGAGGRRFEPRTGHSRTTESKPLEG